MTDENRTYHIAELLPQALRNLAALAGSAPARPEDRPPQSHPSHHAAGRKPATLPLEKVAQFD